MSRISLSTRKWRTPSGPIDIVLSAVGPNETEITFQELDRSSQLFELAKGVLVPTASLDDVIRMKEAADRVKDHLALPELRRLRGDAHPERSRDVDPFEQYDIEDDCPRDATRDARSARPAELSTNSLRRVKCLNLPPYPGVLKKGPKDGKAIEVQHGVPRARGRVSTRLA